MWVPVASWNSESFVPTEHLSIDGMFQICFFPHSIWNVCNLQKVFQHTVSLQSLIEIWVGVLVEHLKAISCQSLTFNEIECSQECMNCTEYVQFKDLNAQGWCREVCLHWQILLALIYILNIKVPYKSLRITLILSKIKEPSNQNYML